MAEKKAAAKAAKPDEDVIKRLETFAAAANMKVYASQADLEPTDRIAFEMLPWCSEHEGFVVMKSGLILTSDPTSRDVQNCRSVMRQKGMKVGKLAAAAPNLITMMVTSVGEEEESTEEAEVSQQTEDFSQQQQRLRMLVKDAIDSDVSDIHIEVRSDVAKIRFRKFGEMMLHAEWFPRLGREAASVAFNKETDHATAHFNPLVPQNASMPLDVEGVFVRLRLASAPAHGGFDVVMRILGVGEEEEAPTLEQLGYTPDQVYVIKRAIRMPHGAVLVAGPTGSGKTTTLASCLYMVSGTKKIYTIEDPVEKVVKHATQVPVNTEKADRSFASFGRAALRMDPDYIILGEMRDEDTVTVMIRAALTGHLVLSTVHTNSSTGIVTRLLDMGVTPVMLSDSGLLVCLIFQRLVAKLCDTCKIPVAEAKKHQEHMDRWKAVFTEDVKTVMARGEDKTCKSCKGAGLGGRTVVAEVVWVDEPSREFIAKGDILGWEKYLKEQGWQDYKDQTLNLVREGMVDPFDAEQIIGEISTTFRLTGFDYSKVAELRAQESNGGK